jgi:uncharacterized membrane protein YcjF (UPF0283 family)
MTGRQIFSLFIGLYSFGWGIYAASRHDWAGTALCAAFGVVFAIVAAIPPTANEWLELAAHHDKQAGRLRAKAREYAARARNLENTP